MESDHSTSEWVANRLAALSAPEWQPDISRGWIRLQERPRPGATVWWVVASATAALCIVALVVPHSRVLAQRLWESVFLKRVEVIEVNPESIESLLPNFTSTSGPLRTVRDAAEASHLAGVRLALPPGMFGTPTLTVLSPIQAHLTLRKQALERDLRRAGAWDVEVPEQWEGVIVTASIPPIAIADYGAWTLMQSKHFSMTFAADVSLKQLGVVVFRILGHGRHEAEELGSKFAANPGWFLGIPREDRARLRHVTLASGPAMLIEDVNDAGTRERLTLLWSTHDRVLALSGRDEFELIRVAESIR